MRLVFVMACLAACMPTASAPPSPTPSAVISDAPRANPAASPTLVASQSPVVPGPPQRSVVTFFRTEDVVRGSAQPTTRVDVSEPLYTMGFGPDPRYAIVSNVGPREPLRLLDLSSGVIESIPLGLGPGALHQLSIERWLPDGRLLVTGREIWVGGPRGENLSSVYARFPFGVVPSRSGTLLAITTHDSSAIVVLDLASGATRMLEGPFRPCVQDGDVAIAWAPDGRALAATDCTDQAQSGMQTRFVTIADGRETRALAELSVAAWLPNGDVIARGPFRARADPEMWVVSASGTRRAIPAIGFYLSPDGRYLLGSVVRPAPTAADPDRREQFAQIVEVATGRVLEVGEGMPAGWTARGEIALISVN